MKEENYLALLFKLSYQDQDKAVNFLSSKYSEVEILSILRQLGINKESVYNKYAPKIMNCDNIVEAILQQDLSEKFLLLLQSKKFYRPSFIEEFGHLGFVIREETFKNSTQQIYNLLSNEEKMPIDDWVASCKSKVVLILGKDSPEEYLKYLEDVASKVESRGYQPLLIKKQPEVETITNEEKMLAYASLARFIIIEKSEAAGQIDEAKICAFNRLPSIWIQKEGTGDTWMQGDYEVDFKSIKTFKYDDSSLEKCLDQGIDWVEGYLKEKANQLNTLYPWRRGQ